MWFFDHDILPRVQSYYWLATVTDMSKECFPFNIFLFYNSSANKYSAIWKNAWNPIIDMIRFVIE